MSELDCGDNSCKYATNRGGMRTNGGCRCSRNEGWKVERKLQHEINDLKVKLEIAEKALEKAKPRIICINAGRHRGKCSFCDAANSVAEALLKIRGDK